MKRILGIDLGVSSAALAVIEKEKNNTEIKKLAVRIVPEDPNFHGKFYSGLTASKHNERTEKRGIRRNNQRFKLRRDALYSVLRKNNLFPNKELLKLDTFKLYELRSKAVTEQITLEELGRILILLNKRRGFLSNRKSNTVEENSTDYKRKIAELENELENKTIGQKLFEELQNVNYFQQILLRERTYLRSSYVEEFDKIWNKQSTFYPEILTGDSKSNNKDTLYNEIRNKIIFYQRPLKSQKGLVSDCEFEPYHKSLTKSSPYFEIFRIWQKINDLSWKTPDGKLHYPTSEQKNILFNALFYNKSDVKGYRGINKKYKLTITEIKRLLGFPSREKVYINFTELDASKTYNQLKEALLKAEIKEPEKYLFFNLSINDEKGGLLELWHITYSLPSEKEVVKTLQKRFNFTEQQSEIIAENVGYKSDYGSLSTRAIRKLLPYMVNGLGYTQACEKVGYDFSGYKTKIPIQKYLEPIEKNSLRNPVVEQVLNQLVNMVNQAIEVYGSFDEIRVELARELRNSAKTRSKISKSNVSNKKENDKIRQRLKDEYNFKIVNGRDVKRYKLWQETEKECLYCGTPISCSDFMNGFAEIEHIIPKSRSFNNNMSNYILAHNKCNSGSSGKNELTAFDFMLSKGELELKRYIERVNALYKDGSGKISRAKFDNLLCEGKDIPSDFVDRMKKDSQYISKEAVKHLKTICKNTYTTTGQVTDFLREKWELKHLLQELMYDKYEAINQVDAKEIKRKDGVKEVKIIKDWSKRDDHRHHAIDALICALTDQKIIFKLNNLNKKYQNHKNSLTKKEIEEFEKFMSDELEDKKLNLKTFADASDNWFDLPVANLREQAKKHLEGIFISVKKDNNKVLTKNTNEPKGGKKQITWVPRKRLHEDTLMGAVKTSKIIPVSKIINCDLIVDENVKREAFKHLSKFNNDYFLAFSAKVLKLQPLFVDKQVVSEVEIFQITKRMKLDDNFTASQFEKIIDKRIKEIVGDRIEENQGKIKGAFSKPLWLNQEKNIAIKRVTITDENKVEKIRNGFSKTGGNHHALIYKNEKGEYKDRVISFYEAVQIGLNNISLSGKPTPVINRKDDDFYGRFQFSMQINDLFVFDLKHSENPQDENEIDFLDPKNRKRISDKLFRVQKMSKKSKGTFEVTYRHHLETSLDRKTKNGKKANMNKLKGIVWREEGSNKHLGAMTKIKINHLGEIIKIGE